MMVRNEDWEGAYRTVVGEGRASGPPTPEEIDAYVRGTLSNEERDRIAELLAYYPDLADAVAGTDGDDGAVAPITDQELAADWRTIQQKLKRSEPVVPFRSSLRKWKLATAASWFVAILLGGSLVRTLMTNRDLRHQLQSPDSSIERLELIEGGMRGSESERTVRLHPATKHLVISLAVADHATDVLDLDLNDRSASPVRTVWTSRVTRGHDGTFSIAIPRAFLTATAYGIDIHDAGQPQIVASYRFRLEDPE